MSFVTSLWSEEITGCDQREVPLSTSSNKQGGTHLTPAGLYVGDDPGVIAGPEEAGNGIPRQERHCLLMRDTAAQPAAAGSFRPVRRARGTVPEQRSGH